MLIALAVVGARGTGITIAELVGTAGLTILRRNRGAVEQGDEADEAGASDGASQLIPGVRQT